MIIDEQTLQDFQCGHIDRLYMLLFPSLLCYAERMLGTQDAFMAEDCVQNAIYRVYLKRKTFADVLSMKSYLFACVHNEVITLKRRKALSDNFIKDQAFSENSLIDELVLQETLYKINKVIDTLSPDQQELFNMSFVDGMKNIEIAERLNLSPETIKKRKAKIVTLLRRHLKDDILAIAILAFLTGQ